MIVRIWHGWTDNAGAAAYEALLRSEVFPGILARQIPGFIHLDLCRRELAEETEFVTLMSFQSQQAISAFAGADAEAAYVPDAARRILARFEPRAAHYELRETVIPAAAIPPPGPSAARS